jgi:D-alanyl-D-alanine carboxypeptidase
MALLLSLTLLAPILGTLPQQDPAARVQAMLDSKVRDNQGNGGGVFRIGIGRDQVLWEGVAGERKRNGGAMQADAQFEIASVSKAFTAAALLLMVEEDLLDLDLPLSHYLPARYTDGLLTIQGTEYGGTLTLGQMLQHTSGLPDYWNDPPYVAGAFNAFLWDYTLAPQRLWQPKEILAYVPDLDPISVPGTGWHYADTGFVIAGLLMEQADGKPLHEIYRDRIFTPLGMNQTWLHWREDGPIGAVDSHRYEGDYDMYTKRQNSADWAAGGLVSTTSDLQVFVHALCTGGLFTDPASLDAMTDWVPTGSSGVEYGLGLFRVEFGFGLGEIWGHDGYGNSWMYYWPRHDVSFTGTLNQTENDWWWMVLGAAFLIEHG